MNKIKLSLIIPCYNSEKYLEKLLESLINQTLKDVEYICVNDGSKDNTLNILNKYSKKYKFIKVIDKKNEGQFKARKDGIMASKGEYIGFIDSDDYVEIDYAEKLYNAIKDNDADIAVCGYSRIDFETGKIYSKEMCDPKFDILYPQKNPGLLLEINSALWNKIYKAEIVKKCIFFETAPKGYEDMVMLQYMYLLTNKIVFVKESLYNYLVINTSTINNIKKELITEIYSSTKDIKTYYQNSNVDMNHYCDANAFLHVGISIPFRMLSDKTFDFNKMVKEITRFLNDNFPTWRKNKYISLSYIIKNRGANIKLWIVQKIYKLHLFKLFLKVYMFILNTFKIDLKW